MIEIDASAAQNEMLAAIKKSIPRSRGCEPTWFVRNNKCKRKRVKKRPFAQEFENAIKFKFT